MRMSQTLTVCSLSAKKKPLSTTSWMPVTGIEPTSASVPAYVLHCVPVWICDVSKRHASLFPIRLPESTSVFGAQPVKVGDGPRYTDTFFEPKLIWNRGEPPPQPSSVTLYFVASCVRLENVVTPVPENEMPLASFAVEASERFETSLSWSPCIDAPPNREPEAAVAPGTIARAAATLKSVKSRFIGGVPPFFLPHQRRCFSSCKITLCV